MDPLLISLLVRLTFSTIGLILNATLVYVTWKDKFLRNSCNLLIALDALTASLYLSGKWSEFALFIQNNDLRLPLSQCFFYHIITNVALFFNKIFMLYIGFDRFLAVNFPFWYEKKKDSIYLCKLMIAAFLIYSIFFIYMVVECFINSGTIIVKCSGFIVLLTTRGNIYNTFWLINLFITIAFYLFMWLKVKYRKKHGHMRSFKYTERLLKSLMVLAIVYFIGNILPTILSMIQPSLDENWAFYFYQIGIYVTILMSSANPILLYICSSDYKAAYRRAFSMQNDSVIVLSQSHN